MLAHSTGRADSWGHGLRAQRSLEARERVIPPGSGSALDLVYHRAGLGQPTGLSVPVCETRPCWGLVERVTASESQVRSQAVPRVLGSRRRVPAGLPALEAPGPLIPGVPAEPSLPGAFSGGPAPAVSQNSSRRSDWTAAAGRAQPAAGTARDVRAGPRRFKGCGRWPRGPTWRCAVPPRHPGRGPRARGLRSNAGPPGPLPPPGAATAGRAGSVTSASRTPAVCTAAAWSPGSAPVRPTGAACCATKVRRRGRRAGGREGCGLCPERPVRP